MAKRELKTKPEEVVETADIDHEVEAAPVEAKKKPVYGTVFNCKKLNVRKKPKGDADVVTVINADTKVSIDMDESTADFYKVTLKGGAYGFCKKEYIKTKA